MVLSYKSRGSDVLKFSLVVILLVAVVVLSLFSLGQHNLQARGDSVCAKAYNNTMHHFVMNSSFESSIFVADMKPGKAHFITVVGLSGECVVNS